ncbi:MAG: hypothetical protein ACKKMV_02150 [Candidatus Nealsonbacteria bacterium]
MKERSRLEFLGIYLLIIFPFILLWVGLGILGASMFGGYIVEYIFYWGGLLGMVLLTAFVIVLYDNYF